MTPQQKIVVLGSMAKMPVAGTVWLTLAYVLGFERLGFEVYYVEAHARTPTTLMERTDDDGSVIAAGFIDAIMRRFDLADRWAFHALHDDGRLFGLSAAKLDALYRDAACIINLHGATQPRPEHVESGRLVYLETDPVELEVELFNGAFDVGELQRSYSAFFTWGTNYGSGDCRVPLPDGIEFRPTLPPVLLDQWELEPVGTRRLFTTVGSWRQEWRDLTLEGQPYYWSKHREFLKFLDLPRCSGGQFELALSRCDEDDRRLLEEHGWRVREAVRVSNDIDTYRRYLVESRGEFTVAKDQNVRLRSGWFSDRSSTYLAAGSPVITQDTGFRTTLPVGEGLFAFGTLDEAVEAVERVNDDPKAHGRAAREIAREHLDARRVLGRIVDELGLGRHAPSKAAVTVEPIPLDLDLAPASRWPTVLSDRTAERVLARCMPAQADPGTAGWAAAASVIVVTYENLVFSRLCIESVLSATDGRLCELLVIDNGSSDETPAYLEKLAATDARVRIVLEPRNIGFPAAVNRGLTIARGEAIVLLNNDTIVAPGWLEGLTAHLAETTIGLICAVSNRAGTAAQIETAYETYGGFLEFARARAREHRGEYTELESLSLFCAAMRRGIYEQVGGLDERFGLGMFEDDDYVRRVRGAGYRIACAEDVLVHHFGQASIGWLARSGAYGALFKENRRKYDQKWATSWRPHQSRRAPGRERAIIRARALVDELVPADGTVLVVSKGDEQLLDLGGRAAWHFLQDDRGSYCGFHPPDSQTAIAQLRQLRQLGASHLLIPQESLWWLQHYEALRAHLEQTGSLLRCDDRACALFELSPGGEQPR